MEGETLSLVEPTAELEANFLELMREFVKEGSLRYQAAYKTASNDFSAYLQNLANISRGVGLTPGRMSETNYWLVRDGEHVLGTSRLRLQISEGLLHEGGHISYDVRPSERRKGYGTRLLALTLEKARQAGLRRVLVTCDTDNIASARVIENNAGVLENQVVSRASGKQVSRYWIDLVESSQDHAGGKPGG